MRIRSCKPLSCLSLALGVIALLVVTPAFAAPPSQRVLEAFEDRLVEVSRNDQRVVEGKLVAIEESSIVIVTDDGAEVTVPRDKIEAIRAVGTPTVPQVTPLEKRAPLPTKTEPGMAYVHIESPESPVQLQTDGETSREERVLCLSPCNRRVDGRLGQQFLLKHRGVSVGAPFDLDGRSASLNIIVDQLPKREQFVIGLVVLGLGGALIPAGIGVAVVGNSLRAAPGSNADTQVNMGYGLIVAASALVPAGIVLAVLGRGSYTIKDRGQGESSERLLSPFVAPTYATASAPGSPETFTGLTAGFVGQF